MSKTAMLLVVVTAVIFGSAQAFAKDAKPVKKPIIIATEVKPVQVKVVSNEMTPDQYGAYLQKKFNLAAAQPTQH